jgi:hypothetical protein
MAVMLERQDNQVISLQDLNSPASHFSNRSYPCDTAHPEKIGAVTVLHLGEHYLLDIFKWEITLIKSDYRAIKKGAS